MASHGHVSNYYINPMHPKFLHEEYKIMISTIPILPYRKVKYPHIPKGASLNKILGS
jgi:hypothetical protein